jgi:hypothetical protein
MAVIDAISAELRTMTAGVDQALKAVTVADGRAQEIAARAARSGFVGIAAGVAEVRNAIGEIRTRVTAVGQSINEAVKPVIAAPQEPSPEQTITALAPATQSVIAAREGITAAIGQVQQTRQMAAMVLRGGQPGPMLTALDAIKQVLDQLAVRCGTALTHLQAAVAQARQTGGSGN